MSFQCACCSTLGAGEYSVLSEIGWKRLETPPEEKPESPHLLLCPECARKSDQGSPVPKPEVNHEDEITQKIKISHPSIQETKTEPETETEPEPETKE